MSMTVAAALHLAREKGIERLDAQLLLGHVTGLSRTALLTRGEEALGPHEVQAYVELLERRADQVPLAYLTGQREFHGLELIITPDVLDPRPDTETLVDWALELMAPSESGRVIDLGTGSGAIALAMKAARPSWDVHASDASPSALAVAHANARALGLAVNLEQGFWWQACSGLTFELVVSNPPYIAEGDTHLQALAHEPRSALVSGSDGLDAIRLIVDGAPAHLHPGGWLLLEHGHDQAAEVATLLHRAGFERISHRRDLAGHTRCTGGRWGGAASA